MSRHLRNRRALSLRTAHALFCAVAFCRTEGDPAGGGGGGTGEPAKKPEKKEEPKKLELTAEELQQRIDAALQKERDRQAEEKKKADAEAERKAAEEKGEFKKLADQRQAENDELKLQIKRGEVREQIRDYLAEHHQAYVGAERYIMPLVEFDAKTSAEDVTKRVKAAAEQFVKDNPRQAAPKGGVIAPPPRSGMNNPKPGAKGTGGNNGTQVADPFAAYMSNRYRGPVQAGQQQN